MSIVRCDKCGFFYEVINYKPCPTCRILKNLEGSMKEEKRFCNLPNKVIAITGEICSGKSTYCKKLEKQGKYVFYADKIVKKCWETKLMKDWLMEHSFLSIEKIVLIEDHKINFRNLRKYLFENKHILKEVEKNIECLFEGEFLKEYITRKLNEPEIEYDRGRSGTEHPYLSYPTIYIEHPLIYKMNIQDQFASIIIMEVDKDIQLERIINRDGCSIETAKQMIERQRG